jgi:hypothetical protein
MGIITRGTWDISPFRDAVEVKKWVEYHGNLALQ